LFQISPSLVAGLLKPTLGCASQQNNGSGIAEVPAAGEGVQRGTLREMVTTKETKAEKLVKEQMLAMLEWASDRPDHNIGQTRRDQTRGRAAEEARRNRDLAGDESISINAAKMTCVRTRKALPS
jgi:hypothetical protein